MDPKLAAIMARRRQQLEAEDEDAEPSDAAERPVHRHAPGSLDEGSCSEALREDAVAGAPIAGVVVRGDSRTAVAADISPAADTQRAGVGMTLTDSCPFVVIAMKDGGPAAHSMVIRQGDELVSVDGEPTGGLMGSEVVRRVVGLVGSEVDLEFRRSAKHVYRTRLVRQKADERSSSPAAESTILADQGDSALASAVPVYEDDFDSAEPAIKHAYNPRTKEWARTLINVIIQPQPFAEGNLRTAYHMKDLSVLGNDSRYVLKMSKDPDEEPGSYFDDVQMQMEAKMYAELFNAHNPPKKVSFLDAYVLELKDRPGSRICAVEKFIDGEYKKYNNNWSFVDDERNTPQAFSHFTYERSQRTILVCDIQVSLLSSLDHPSVFFCIFELCRLVCISCVLI